MLKQIGILACLTLIGGCSLLQGTPSENHKALCGQLRNKIVMNGASALPRNAELQRDDLHTLDKTYRDEGC